VIASILVSVLFLFLALNDVPITEIVSSLRQANLIWIFIALMMGTLALWTRAVRWRGLLQNRINLIESFYILSITMLLNQLPMRTGEVARTVLATRSGVPFFTGATSVLVERLLDTLSVVIVLSLTLTQVPDVSATITQTAILFGLVGIVALCLLFFFARYPQVARDLLGFFMNLIPIIQKLPLLSLMENILDGIKPLAHWHTATHAIVWTIISWGFSYLTGYFTVRALGIIDNTVVMTFLSITLASFAIAIPVSVASIGPFESAVLVAGQAINLGKAISGALGFLLHGIFVMTYIIWGTLGLIVLGVSLGDMLKSKNSEKESDTVANTDIQRV